MKTRKLIALMVLLLVTAGVQAGGDAARGAELAEDCAMCHGDDGLGDDHFPAIAGQDEAVFIKKMTGFKTGAVANLDMEEFVVDLSEQDIADLAAYYSALPGK